MSKHSSQLSQGQPYDPTQGSESESCSSISAEDSQFLLRRQSRSHYFWNALHGRLIRLWIYVVLGLNLIVATIFIFTFVVQPSTTSSLRSRNFISNNPIKTNQTSTDGVSKWLEDFSYSAIPVMCHSHNDYTRPYSLFSALAAGCASVEADVWSTPDGKDLLVGHNRRSLSPDRTLQSLYINPLLEILSTLNPSNSWYNITGRDPALGVFRTEPYKTLILFIDIKDDPAKTWPLVLEQLEPLRKKFYLSRHQILSLENGTPIPNTLWLGPVTVVGTGNILDRRDINYGADREAWRQYHDVFLDAPLDQLTLDETTSDEEQDKAVNTLNAWSENEFYAASVSFWKAIGSVHAGFSSSQLSKLRRQVAAAQRQGLVTRYWGLPEWPISHRDYVWKVLIREGVDLLNANDIMSAAKRDWSRGYARETIWISLVSVYILIASALLLWFGHRTIQRELQHLDKLEIHNSA